MMMIIIIIINNANIQPLYAQDRPCVMKSHILQEVALFNI
jgi:hypothetical protein